jgi:hypothetical protein
MRFKVPQFLEIEDKIFGPFTFSQFAYLAGGAGICFFLYKLLGFFLGLIPMLLIAGFALTLTFYKPNNKPFVDMLEASIVYVAQSKLYIWKRRKVKKQVKKKPEEIAVVETSDPRLNSSKLRDLAWSLDILDTEKAKKENEEDN